MTLVAVAEDAFIFPVSIYLPVASLHGDRKAYVSLLKAVSPAHVMLCLNRLILLIFIKFFTRNYVTFMQTVVTVDHSRPP